MENEQSSCLMNEDKKKWKEEGKLCYLEALRFSIVRSYHIFHLKSTPIPVYSLVLKQSSSCRPFEIYLRVELFYDFCSTQLVAIKISFLLPGTVVFCDFVITVILLVVPSFHWGVLPVLKRPEGQVNDTNVQLYSHTPCSIRPYVAVDHTPPLLPLIALHSSRTYHNSKLR